MSGHALRSPSAAPRYTRCAGSIREEAKYPDNTNTAAIDGTHTHTLIEKCIQDGLVSPMLYVDKELEDYDGKFIVDVDRATRANEMIDYILQQQSQYPELVITSEEKVDPAGYMLRDDMSGTLDCSLEGQYHLEIIDYKDGMNPVSPDSEQLTIYGVAKYVQLYQRDRKKAESLNAIRCTIVQPKLAYNNMEIINTKTWTPDAFFAEATRIREATNLTDDPNAPLTPGDMQCKYCRAKGGCAAHAQHALGKVQGLFGEVTPVIEPMQIAEQATVLDVNMLSNDKIADMVEATPLIRAFLEAVNEEGLRRVNLGQDIPHTKLVRGRGSRKWNLPDGEMAKKLTSCGIPKGEVYSQKLVSPAQVEKLRWKNRAGDAKSLSEKQLKRIKDNFIETTKGKLTLVPETDSRPALETKAKDIFKDVTPVQDTPELPTWLLPTTGA